MPLVFVKLLAEWCARGAGDRKRAYHAGLGLASAAVPENDQCGNCSEVPKGGNTFICLRLTKSLLPGLALQAATAQGMGVRGAAGTPGGQM